MTIDTSIAHLINGDGKAFQVLKPQEFATVQTGEDEDGNPITEQVALPREWDEAATYAAYAKATGE